MLWWWWVVEIKKNSEPEKVDLGEGVCIRQGGKDLRDGGG
jgi:hypothetical protein